MFSFFSSHCWARRRSVSYPYLQILLHAVCRDTEAYPQPCIYCHVDQGDDETLEVRFVPADAAAPAAGEGGPEGTASATAVAPAGAASEVTEEEEANVLDEIFRVMSECASLHMDPVEEAELGAGGVAGIADADLAGGDYFFTAADFAHGVSDEGAQNLERLDGLIQVRFVSFLPRTKSSHHAPPARTSTNLIHAHRHSTTA